MDSRLQFSTTSKLVLTCCHLCCCVTRIVGHLCVGRVVHRLFGNTDMVLKVNELSHISWKRMVTI